MAEKTYRCRYCDDEFTCCAECDADPEPPEYCSTEHLAADVQRASFSGLMDDPTLYGVPEHLHAWWADRP